MRRINKKLLKYVGEKIKSLIKKKGVSYIQFRDDTGINLGRILIGERDISISTLQLVCDYFDISIRDFMKDFK